MAVQPPARRGLGDLDEGIPEPARVCAQHLRDLRDRTGLTSGELAKRLSASGFRVDETRLSKFFNGREVPRRDFALNLHQIVAEIEDCDVSPEETKRTRDLMYAAVSVRRPLQAREFEIADAREELERQRYHAEEQRDALQREVEAERRKREAAEHALAELSSRTENEVRDLILKRDVAERRVAELEQQMQQLAAFMRLQAGDSRTLAERAGATSAELVLLDLTTIPDDVAEVFRILVDWRNHFQDEQADQLLERFVVSPLDPSVWPWKSPIFDLYKTFIAADRRLDAQRLISMLIRLKTPMELFDLTSFCFGGMEDGVHGEESRAWIRSMLPTLAREAPTWTLLYFHRLCIETNEANLAWALRRYVLRIRPEPQDSENPHEAELLQRARIESSEALPEPDPEWRTFDAQQWSYWTGLQ